MTLTVETPAGFGPRLVAAAIDYAIVAVANSAFADIAPDGWFVIAISYFVLTTGLLGRTPGKIALGIHLRSERGRIDLATAGLREAVGKLISASVLGLGFVWIAFDPEKRGWHDLIARTRAVRVTSIPWPEEYERDITLALATAGEATPAMLKRIPPQWQVPALRAFAGRYRGDVVMDGQVLRPTGEVEWF